jgi:polyisoprenyl-teichoic acid--peptidoglycan teichoic acid transferase
MPHNYIDPDNSRQSHTPYGASPDQSKLVLGSFQNQPPQQPGQRPYAGQGAYMPPNQAGAAGQYGAPYNPNAPTKAPRKRRRNPILRIGCITMLVILVIVIIFGLITVPRVLAFGSHISKQAPLSMSGDMSTNNRTNLLVLGYGGGGHDGAYLTDSMLVISLLPQSHHTSLVSVPRDLWVQNSCTQTQTKINAIYTCASNNNQDPEAGGQAVTNEAGSIIGMNVKYWMTIDFTGFRELIDSIGGIDVYVPDSFSSNYPVNDDPNVDASWKVVTFNKGNQHMDGETAIEYARAREPILDPTQGIVNPAEGTDFARSARQQIIIKATLSEMKQITTWPKLFNALDALQNTIHTNLSLADLAQFSLDTDLNSSQTAHIGLSTDNVLVNATSDDGQDILEPQNNDWGTTASYVQQHLYN